MICHQESRDLQDEVTEIQKKRLGMLWFTTKKVQLDWDVVFTVQFLTNDVCVCLEMKRLTHEKMKEMEEMMSKKEHPDTEKYKAALEKGQANLEKYKKMAIMTQNVLRVNSAGIV